MNKPENERKNVWKDLRAIAVVHQSSDAEGTASTAAQLDFMKKDLAARQMQLVDAEVLEGVAASAPARINEVLEKLFARKRAHDDFDVVAWLVEDRASRGGGEHGMWLEHEAKRHGLLVYFAGDETPSGPYRAVVRVAKYEGAKDLSYNNGRRTAQGQEWAKKQGFFRTGGPTPFGCDRLYCGADDQPKFILRNLPDGRQEQRDWTTGRVIATYGTIGKKSRNRFRKQRNEYSLLVPGDREQRRVVRVIFYLRYKKGWRGWRIADYLNSHGISAPRGGDWHPRQVESIYENEAYTGVTYNNQIYSGRFFRRDRELGFVALERDERELVLKKSFTPQLRPAEEWDRIDQPYMYDFLPRDVRDLAIAAQAQLWQHRADPARLRRQISGHPASDYLLSGKLRALQDGETLVGSLSGPRGGTKTQYYRHRKGRKGRQKDSVYNNLIPAKPLHEEIVRLLAGMLANAPDLRERLRQHVLQQRTAALENQPDVAALQTERQELKEQITTIVRSLKGAALEDAREELERLGQRRNAVEAMLANVQSARQQDQRPVEQVVEEAVRVLGEQSQRLLSLPVASLREVVDRLVLEARVDMATKQVELNLALPTWALTPQSQQKKPKRGHKGGSGAAGAAGTEEAVDETMCLPTSTWSSTGGQTQHDEPGAAVDLKAGAWPGLEVLMAEVICRYKRGQRSICYECFRKPRSQS